jgi:Holliday junction resolvase RusA-like endonuclease
LTDTISFFVGGEPQPKGSTRAFVVKGRPIITSSNKNLKQWELRIAHEAQAEAAKVNWKFGPEDAYTIAADFKFQLPKSRPRKWRHQHTVKPDLDKVLRALNDALTNILISDDSQIVNAEVGKSYCEGDEQPGLYVALEKFPGRMLR